MLTGQDITIMGGGIGGFAAACALAAHGGAGVRVLEQAPPDLGEVGAGLQISPPNGVRVLDALGLGDEARSRSTGRAVCGCAMG